MEGVDEPYEGEEVNGQHEEEDLARRKRLSARRRELDLGRRTVPMLMILLSSETLFAVA